MALPASLTRWFLRLAFGLLGLLAFTAAPAPAQEQIAAPHEDFRSPLSIDLQCVPPDAAAIVSLNVAKVWKSKSARLLRNWVAQQQEAIDSFLAPMGLDPGDIDRITLVQYRKDLSGILKAKKPLNRAKLVRTFAPKAQQRNLRGMPYYINEERWVGFVFLDDHTLLVGKADDVEAMLASFPSREEPLSAGQEAIVAGHDLVIAIHPTHLARFVAQIEPTIRPLFQTSSVLLLADFAASEMHAEVHLDCNNGRLARTLDQLLHKLCDQAEEPSQPDGYYEWIFGEKDRQRILALEKFAKALAIGLKDLKTDCHEQRLHAYLTVHTHDSVIAVVFISQEFVLNRMTSGEPTVSPVDESQQLRKLGQAMLEFHRKTGRFPPAALCDKNGKAMLSWRVALLPYLGQGDLYKKFRLDEPWDSENNRKLIQRIPEVFQSREGDDTPTTAYQVFVGKGTAFDGKKGKRLRDFKDGPEQTILIAQANHRVPWTKPEDMHYSADKRLPEFAAQLSEVVLANGQVVHLPGSPYASNPFGGDGEKGVMAPLEKQLRALITRNGADKSEAQALLSLCGTPQAPQDPPTVQPAVYPPPYGGVPLPQYLPPPPNPYGLPPSPYPNTLPPPPYGLPGPLPGMPVMPLPPPEGRERPEPFEDQPR
jgi:Protein of unknown function (DUF1559)